MNNATWENKGTEFLAVVNKSKGAPAYAYCLCRNKEVYYVCILEMKVDGKYLNVCLISDATEYGNTNYRAALSHYRKSCLKISEHAELFANKLLSNGLNIENISSADWRFNYNMVGLVIFGIDLSGYPVVLPVEILLNKEYQRMGLANSVFDFLSEKMCVNGDRDQRLLIKISHIDTSGEDATMI